MGDGILNYTISEAKTTCTPRSPRSWPAHSSLSKTLSSGISVLFFHQHSTRFFRIRWLGQRSALVCQTQAFGPMAPHLFVSVGAPSPICGKNMPCSRDLCTRLLAVAFSRRSSFGPRRSDACCRAWEVVSWELERTPRWHGRKFFALKGRWEHCWLGRPFDEIQFTRKDWENAKDCKIWGFV